MTIEPRVVPSFAPQRIPSIGELVRQVASLLERSMPLSWVGGEISNLMRASSGHWYFSLKDREAQVRCVMFRSRNQQVDWAPRDGDRIEARVLPGLYAPRGEFQLQVEQMRRAGAGALFEAFLRIKATLDAAGMFDVERKRPLPAHPARIGVVTSTQAAALRDVLATLARRAPHVGIIVFPTSVQGAEAPARIVEAIARAAHPGAVHPVDVLLIVRGGGSIEDLWAFNDERVAHAIAAAVVPVVSGVGHETDFTIADFVADVRAPTPTAAAELASPDAPALTLAVARRKLALQRAMERTLEKIAQRIDDDVRRLRSPDQRLRAAHERVTALSRRVSRAQAVRVTEGTRAVGLLRTRLRAGAPHAGRLSAKPATLRDRLMRAVAERVRIAIAAAEGSRQRLGLLDPKGVLERGYAIATDENGRVVRDASRLQAGQKVVVEVASGSFSSTVDRPQ